MNSSLSNLLGFEVEQICEDGDVKLVGGINGTQGVVEVCYNNAWGTVCNSRFGTNEALVICNQLGFRTIGKSDTTTQILCNSCHIRKLSLFQEHFP